MHASLKKTLLTLAVCSSATYPCAIGLGQENFIRQPGQTSAQATQPHSSAPQFITRPSGLVLQPGMGSDSRLPAPTARRDTTTVRALPRPSVAGPASENRSTKLPSPGEIQWVPSTRPRPVRPPAAQASTTQVGEAPKKRLPATQTAWTRQDANTKTVSSSTRSEPTVASGLGGEAGGIQLELEPPEPGGARSLAHYESGNNATSTSNEHPNAPRAATEARLARSSSVGSHQVEQSLLTREDLLSTPSLTPPAVQPTAAELEAARKSQLASAITESMAATEPNRGLPTHSVDNPEGWKAVAHRIDQHRAECQRLLGRRAFFSARDEALKAARYLMQMIDLHVGSFTSEPTMADAMVALQEARDFSSSDESHGPADVQRLVDSHTSNALKPYNLAGVSPLAAAQHYRIWAANRLVDAAQNHPYASELFYMIGRIAQEQALARRGIQRSHLQWEAITFYRAAAAIDPQNSLALNNLGFMFLQLDRPADAKEALLASVSIGTTPEAAKNLLIASQQLGDAQLAGWAAGRIQPAAPAPRPRPQITYVSGQTFVAMNPANQARQQVAPNQRFAPPASMPVQTPVRQAMPMQPAVYAR